MGKGALDADRQGRQDAAEQNPHRGKTQEQVAAWQERTARQELPLLDELAQDLEVLTREMFTPPIPYQFANSADLMALSFATKQHEHLRSVRALIAAGLYRDAQVIARTMLEAWGRLLWAFNAVPERTDRWFYFGAILDWRQMKRNKDADMMVDLEDEAALKAYVDQNGPTYYKKEVRKRIDNAQQDGTTDKIPDDPWEQSNWAGWDVRSMFEELGEGSLYDRFYRRTSEWAHSGPRAILIAADLQRTGTREWGPDQFTDNDVRAGAWTLSMACKSLLRALEVLNAQFSRGQDERLDDIAEKLNAIIEAPLASAP